MTIGERIKAAREKAGLTQVQLGEKVGVSGVAIMRYENGTREPRYDRLKRISDALGISIYELFDGSTVDADGTINIWPAPQNASGSPPKLVEEEGPISTPEVVEHGATTDELEALIAKLQDGKPLLLSPDELAKLKATPKEQIAAALDKPIPAVDMEAHGAGDHAFYCRLVERPELNALCLKFQNGTITQDERERMDVLLAIATKLEDYDPSQWDFSDNLRNYRDAVGLSRKALSDKTGDPAEKIRDYEDISQIIFVTEFDLDRIARFFGEEPQRFKGRSETQEWMERTYFQNARPKERIAAALDRLNPFGQEKVATYAEDLAGMPKYQAQEPPTAPAQATPTPQESKDTTPAEAPREGPQEPPEGRIQSITMICPICGQHLRGDLSTGEAYCNHCQRSFPLPQILK